MRAIRVIRVFRGKTNLLFYLLLLLLPTQLGYHFWPKFAFVWGLRIDYLAPTIYLTDLLVLGILASWGVSKLKVKSQKLKVTVKSLKFLFLPFLFLLINCLLAENRGAAFYKLVKLGEFFLLGLYVMKRVSLGKVTSPLLLAVVYSCLIAMLQFFKQASLGGIFWWLGERTFNSTTPGIARAEFLGREVLRPYATFSHPNCLAGFLLVGIILILGNLGNLGSLGKLGKLGVLNHTTVGYPTWFPMGFRVKFWGVVILVAATIFLTFSRAVWVVLLLIVNCLLLIVMRRRRGASWLLKLSTFLVFLFFSFLILQFFNSSVRSSLSFQRRTALNKAALRMVKVSPLLGVGLNNFITRLPEFWGLTEAVRFLQPAHNIYLLVGAEVGVLGFLGILGFLGKTILKVYKEGRWSIFWALVAVLLLGMVDHYWWTLQQNQLLLAMVLGWGWKKEARI